MDWLAVLYAVEMEAGGWRCEWSIDWETDLTFWLADSGGRPRARRLVRLAEELPVGAAELAAGRFAGDSGRRWRVLRRERGPERLRQAAAAALRAVGTRSGTAEEMALDVREEVSAIRREDREQTVSAERLAGLLAGRSLLLAEALGLFAAEGGEQAAAPALLQRARLTGRLRLVAAIDPRTGRCRRCGSGRRSMRRYPCATCGRDCAVCETCLQLGRSRACAVLVLGEAAVRSRRIGGVCRPKPLDAWGLSPAQQAASAAALRFLREPRRAGGEFLLWAVAGAGKTEMLFPLLADTLARGGRALVATPRRDVVLELAPRLAAAFPDVELVVLYGGSEDRWKSGALILATTHQLLRFHQAFDLVVIDELDAFPYHGDPMLRYAADKCRLPHGRTVLLSATPPAALRRRVRLRRLPCARVPVRYHRHPLPVPQQLCVPPVQRWLAADKLPQPLLPALRASVLRGAQLFLFVPRIRLVEPLVQLLRRQAALLGVAPERIGGTSSRDGARGDKVGAFRGRELRILVTTTILERGVTIPRSDVYILDADAPAFDEAALVQMAGRAGRSADDPVGQAWFCAPVRTAAQRRAARHIRAMNRLARRRGYLLPAGRPRS